MAKYRVYGNYIFSKVLGEYEADSEEDAIEKALKSAEWKTTLCVRCSQDFVDSGELDYDSWSVDLIEG